MGGRMTRGLLWAFALVLLAVWPVRAQYVVFDPAVTLRNSINAGLQELLFNVQRQQRRQIRRMARRLSFFTNLDKYALMDTPEWRIHDFFTDAVLFARDYHAALTYGDRSGSAYVGVTTPLVASTAAIRLRACPPTVTNWPPTKTVLPETARQKTVLLAPGFHADTVPFALIRASRLRATPPTSVNVPPMYQPPAPSGTAA